MPPYISSCRYNLERQANLQAETVDPGNNHLQEDLFIPESVEQLTEQLDSPFESTLFLVFSFSLTVLIVLAIPLLDHKTWFY